MALNSGKILMRRGQEVNFDPNKMVPGEWAVSLDSKYVRMCFQPGVCVRMATYDAFEADMVQMQKILAECQTIEEAVERINDEISVKAQAVAEYTAQARQYRDEAKSYKEQASAIANVDTATESNMGLMAGGENSVDGGVLTLTKTTNDKTLLKSYKGGIIINEILGESLQDVLPSPDSPQEIKSVKISGIRACGKNLWPYGDVSGTLNATKTFKLKAGKYVISSNTTSSDTDDTSCLIAMIYEDDTRQNAYLSRNKRSSNVVTLSKNIKTIIFYASTDWTKSNGDSFTFKDIQIEEGATVTDYEPYQETNATFSTPITLNGISNVKDVLCKQDGVYGVKRKVDKYIIDGTEEWAKNSSSLSDYIYYFFKNTEGLTIKSNNGYCSHFKVVNTSLELDNAILMYDSTYSNTLYLGASAMGLETNTTSALKAWLAENNVEIMYELATPVFEPLSESDQIALHKLESQNSITHLFVESAIVPVMEVEYGTSKVGAYAIKGMNTAEANAIKYNSLMAATLMLNQE